MRLSGFPEWLPGGRVVERAVLASLRRSFELHGFVEIETRAVEPLADLLRKGDTSKEVYVLSRLQDDGGGAVADGAAHADPRAKRLGLHFDLTIPLARYVLENAGTLQFPFRRYQIQKVWRGERPQEGRFREFIQADVDVVGAGELPGHIEVELPLVIADAFAALAEIGVPPIRIHVNHRKLVEGCYRAIGIANVDAALRCVDKLDKLGRAKVGEELATEASASPTQAALCLELAGIATSDPQELVLRVEALAARAGIVNRSLDEGLVELAALLSAANRAAPGVFVADLKIARGLDYYTGAVYETFLAGHEDLGSICSGGRYDTLASDGNRTFPGVGLSIGVSRLVARLLSAELVRPTRATPSAVLVTVAADADRDRSNAIATALRTRGIPAEVCPSAAKYGKQIQFADRRGIPYVWFPGTGETDCEVKDVRTGEQRPANSASWRPPQADHWPRVIPAQGSI